MTATKAVPKEAFPKFSHNERRMMSRLINRLDHLSINQAQIGISRKNEMEAMAWLVPYLWCIGGGDCPSYLEFNPDAWRRLHSRLDFLDKKLDPNSYEIEELIAMRWAFDLVRAQNVVVEDANV